MVVGVEGTGHGTAVPGEDAVDREGPGAGQRAAIAQAEVVDLDVIRGRGADRDSTAAGHGDEAAAGKGGAWVQDLIAGGEDQRGGAATGVEVAGALAAATEAQDATLHLDLAACLVIEVDG